MLNVAQPQFNATAQRGQAATKPERRLAAGWVRSAARSRLQAGAPPRGTSSPKATDLGGWQCKGRCLPRQIETASAVKPHSTFAPSRCLASLRNFHLCVQKVCHILATMSHFDSAFSLQPSAFPSKLLQNQALPHKNPCSSVKSVSEKTFKKKSKKMLTPALLSGRLTPHTVTTEQQHKIK